MTTTNPQATTPPRDKWGREIRVGDTLMRIKGRWVVLALDVIGPETCEVVHRQPGVTRLDVSISPYRGSIKRDSLGRPVLEGEPSCIIGELEPPESDGREPQWYCAKHGILRATLDANNRGWMCGQCGFDPAARQPGATELGYGSTYQGRADSLWLTNVTGLFGWQHHPIEPTCLGSVWKHPLGLAIPHKFVKALDSAGITKYFACSACRHWIHGPTLIVVGKSFCESCGERVNEGHDATLPPSISPATGTYLDNLAPIYGIPERREAETDSELRARLRAKVEEYTAPIIVRPPEMTVYDGGMKMLRALTSGTSLHPDGCGFANPDLLCCVCQCIADAGPRTESSAEAKIAQWATEARAHARFLGWRGVKFRTGSDGLQELGRKVVGR